MAALTVRNLTDEVMFALKARAKSHHRSTEAEVREILKEAVMPSHQVPMGEAIMELSAHYQISNEDIDQIENTRDNSPAQPMSFE